MNEERIKDKVKAEIVVNEQKISVIRIGNKEYISLTDLARYADNKEVVSYLGSWESINNEKFKGSEFDTFKNEAGSNRFKMSLKNG